MLDGGDWPRGGPMWRSGPRQIFFFLKHPPTVHSLGSTLGVGRVALHRTGGRSAAAFRPSLRSRRNAAVDRPPVRCSATRPPPRADPSSTLEVAEVGYPTVTLDTSGKNGVQYVSLGGLRSNLYNLCMISFNKIFFQKIGFYKVV